MYECVYLYSLQKEKYSVIGKKQFISSLEQLAESRDTINWGCTPQKVKK